MPDSAQLRRIYASAPVDFLMVQTLALKHSQFSQTYYLTNEPKDWTFELETGGNQLFTAIPFEIQLPTNNTQGGQMLRIAIANIGRLMIEEIESAITMPLEPIVCEYRVYLNAPNSLPQNDPILTMTIHSLTINENALALQAGRFDILNNRFPRVLYNTDYFPGLLR